MIDSHYMVGGRHIVCQDYALHGLLDGIQYVIVSDGCSSAKYSEVGSQILCHAAKYQIELAYKSGLMDECSLKVLATYLGNSILKRVDEIRKSFPIDREALEATLLLAINYGPKTYVIGWGDGVVIFEYADDSISIAEIDHQNKPFYLVHSSEEHFNKWGIEEYIHRFYDGDTTPAERKVPFNETFRMVFEPKENLSDLVSITVCSDGISSFRDSDGKIVGLEEMAPQFVNFKTIVGGFVKKRLFFMKKSAEKRGWTYADDVSSGTILL